MNLERRLDTDQRYLDFLGNTLEAARLQLKLMLTTGRNNGKVINGLKEEFYNNLQEFINSGYHPTKKINHKSLDRFYRYRLADWCVEKNFQRVEGYFYSLYNTEK